MRPNNRVQESLWNGVPLLGVPRFGDQLTNAARMEELGVGIVLETQLASTVLYSKLKNTIGLLLTERRFGEASRRLQKVLQHAGAHETLN